MKSPVARFMLATRNNKAATLLMLRIAYWWPKTVIEMDGRRWIVKSRQQWQEETGLTDKEIRTAITLLKSAAIIDVEVHLFQKKTLTHITLTEKGEAIITGKDPMALGGHSGMALEGQSGIALEGQTGLALEGPTYVQGDYALSLDNEVTLSHSVEPHANSGEVSPLPGEEDPNPPLPPFPAKAGGGKVGATGPKGDKEVTLMPDPGKKYSVQDVIASGAGMKPKPKPKKVDAIAALAIRWQELVSKKAGGYAAPLSGIDKSLLKKFVGDLPAEFLTGGKVDPLQVMEYLLANWSALCAEVKSTAGKVISQVPRMKDMHAHKDVAISFALNGLQAQLAFASKAEILPTLDELPTKAAESVPVVEEDEAKPQTLAELLAILNAPVEED